ncbi:hypothetical protein P3T76_016173 [Phytophthora citrophthora]|uniref:Uncharacterized protein n=1 Tax=Phytophthora citrophthora TaxID=4793 RepID=A0AAD9FY20_9STRA|nr:hypothetical protein P3T76_016173 [Phytophthora citrophthora]
MVFAPAAISEFGAHNMLRVFNVIRCSVLYMLWLHHNDCMMNGSTTNKDFVVQRTQAYVRLHFQRMCLAGNPRLRQLCGRWLPSSSNDNGEQSGGHGV